MYGKEKSLNCLPPPKTKPENIQNQDWIGPTYNPSEELEIENRKHEINERFYNHLFCVWVLAFLSVIRASHRETATGKQKKTTDRPGDCIDRRNPNIGIKCNNEIEFKLNMYSAIYLPIDNIEAIRYKNVYILMEYGDVMCHLHILCLCKTIKIFIGILCD